MKKVMDLFRQERGILGVYVLLCIAIGFQHYLGGPGKYNNFRIFRAALGHLIRHQNLHVPYPEEYFDLFLYNPSFCIFFAPFSLLPQPVSLMLWLILCAMVLFFSIRSLPLRQQDKVFFWWFILFELITSLHGQQTNPLIAACGLFTFTFLETGKTRWAALMPLLAFCIKGYGLIFAALFIFYPRKGRYIGYSVMWAAMLALLPLPVTGFENFLNVYRQWLVILIQDQQVNYGFSIMGLLKVWFVDFSTGQVTIVQLVGVLLFVSTWLLCFIRKQYLLLNQRLLLVAYVSLWVIMFNHSAESPTYVIAIPGVVLFYVCNREKYKYGSKILVMLVFMFSVLAPTDIYPHSLRRNFFEPYLIKVVPCLLTWVVLQLQLLLNDHEG